MAEEPGRFWSRQARRLARRANLGFWFESFMPAALAISLVASPLLLLTRRHGGAERLGVAVLVALLAAAAWAFTRTKSRRFTEADGRVRIEAVLGLEGRLSAAAARVAPWPEVGLFRAPARWKRGRLAAPVLFALTFPAAAALVPVSRAGAGPPGRPESPLSWTQAEEWLEDLAENPVVEPESLASFEERLKQLRAEPEDRWYRESNLEAADSLRDQLRTEVRSLATDLDAAASALESAEAGGDPATDPLQGSLRSLQSRTLAVRPELLSRLKAAAQRRRLSPMDASALGRKLREGAGFCRLSLRECRPGDDNCVATAGRRAPRGRGGVARGPGTAPLTLDPDAVMREPGRLEGLSSEDLRQAALGEVVATTQAPPRAAQGALRVVEGGAAATGTGGDAVGRSVLTPEERRVLKRYFKE